MEKDEEREREGRRLMIPTFKYTDGQGVCCYSFLFLGYPCYCGCCKARSGWKADDEGDGGRCTRVLSTLDKSGELESLPLFIQESRSKHLGGIGGYRRNSRLQDTIHVQILHTVDS